MSQCGQTGNELKRGQVNCSFWIAGVFVLRAGATNFTFALLPCPGVFSLEI